MKMAAMSVVGSQLKLIHSFQLGSPSINHLTLSQFRSLYKIKVVAIELLNKAIKRGYMTVISLFNSF